MAHSTKCGGITKVATGIRGFDEITGGGLPRERTTLVMGGPGSGKTVFALQTLVTGALKREPGILVTFQESPRQIVENAATFGWNLAALEKERLILMDARIRPEVFKSIELYLTGMLAGIKVVAQETRARRVVFDSLDTLLYLLGDLTAERQEIFRLRDWLLESGLTAVITTQVEGDDSFLSQRHGFMQFMADCVVSLNHQVTNPASRSLRVLKYRGSGFAENEFPMVIGPAGLDVSCGRKGQVAAGIQQEIAQAQSGFQARIELLNRQLEIKQAELDFLKTVATRPENMEVGRGEIFSKARGVKSRKGNAGGGRPAGRRNPVIRPRT